MTIINKNLLDRIHATPQVSPSWEIVTSTSVGIEQPESAKKISIMILYLQQIWSYYDFNKTHLYRHQTKLEIKMTC